MMVTISRVLRLASLLASLLLTVYFLQHFSYNKPSSESSGSYYSDVFPLSSIAPAPGKQTRKPEELNLNNTHRPPVTGPVGNPVLTTGGPVISSPVEDQQIGPEHNYTDKVEFGELMERRVGLLREGCNKTESLRRKFNSRAFYALPVSSLLPCWLSPLSSQDRSLVWCPVFKAASTNWMHNLLQLTGRNQFEIQQIMEEHPK